MVRAIERGRLADGAKAREADGEGMGCVLTRPGSDRAAESGADFLRERVSDGVRIFFLAMVMMCDTERSLRIVCMSVNGI